MFEAYYHGMNFFERLLDVLSYSTAQKPQLFGPCHMAFIFAVVVVTLLLCFMQKNASDKKFRFIVGVFWVVIVLFEIYKQLQFSCHTDGTTAYWKYQWYAFPFQFCSSPLFILPFLIFAPEGKLRDAAASFTVTFSLFAGLAVFAYPSTILIKETLITIQSLVHHGSQVILGIYVAVYYRKKLNWKFFLKGVYVFLILSAIAMVMNLTVYHFIPEGETFNMFYISPYYVSSLPVLDIIYKMVPYPVFLLAYVLGFTACGAIVFAAELGVRKLAKRKGENEMQKAN